jgi:hypothetical protein
LPFIILLDDSTDFAAEKFVYAIEAAGHGGINAEMLKTEMLK